MDAKNYFAEIMSQIVGKSEEIGKALDVVRRNSRGNIWLIGGSVYWELSNNLYGDIPEGKKDYDFLVENTRPEIEVPEGWDITRNGFGNPRFNLDGLAVDFVPLKSLYSTAVRGIEPNVHNYLTGVPLTVQFIAYNVENKQILGDVGVKAIQERTVGVYNYDFAKYLSNKRGTSIEEMVKRKADSLNFRAI